MLNGHDHDYQRWVPLDANGNPPGRFSNGAGTTEFVVGTEKPEGSVSIDMGCVRITEQFLHNPVKVEVARPATTSGLNPSVSYFTTTRPSRTSVGPPPRT